ncbi:hypothetical protein G3465_11730 [Shewanella baltica]|uniref:hypothetical protein n=1 Tax=Shewanella baltica TaxID=62322 RepID=UPI00217E74AF|nr:hypothetical protein [Shewanella baltica]MCS6153568.1 hypothetical protein [Shewanella baltica]
MTTLEQKVLKHIEGYCKINAIEIDAETILADLHEFLERVNAPDDLSAFFQLIVLITRVNNVSTEVANFIQKMLCLAPYIYNAFHAHQMVVNDLSINKEFYRNTYRKGWCHERPFYVLLICSWKYKVDYHSCALLAAFIKQYFDTLDSLTDPEFATKTTSREEEACSNFRLMMELGDKTFDASRVHILNSHLDSPESIAANLDSIFAGKYSKLNIYPTSHVRVLRHFFRNSWCPAISRTRGHGDKDRGPKRYGDPVTDPIVGTDDGLSAILPQDNMIPDSEGLDEDDFYPSQSFVMANADMSEKRDRTALLDVAINFNPMVKHRTEIDVTSRVRRSHNIGMQNTQLLMPAELYLLAKKLLVYGRSGSTRETAIILWTMLILSKSVSEVKNLCVFRDLSSKKQGLYIDPSGNGWWCFPLSHSTGPRLNQIGLRKTVEDVFTACPNFLVKLITIHMGARLVGNLIEDVDVEKIESKLAQKLAKISDNSGGGRLSLKRLTNFVCNYINSTNVIDPIYIDFSYAVNMYTTRVARSYSSVRDQKRCEQLLHFWNDVEKGISVYSGNPLTVSLFELRYWQQDEQYLGSTFTPTQATIQQLIIHLSLQTKALFPTPQHRLEDILAYHNAFVAYTAWMLLFGTGYRAAWNPLPTLALFLPSFNLMGISDKDDSDFTHSRIVAIPSVLTAQLVEYRRHLGCLRGLLRLLMPQLCSELDNIIDVDRQVLSYDNLQASAWYTKIRNSRSQHGPFFFFQKQKSGIVTRSLSPSQLISVLKEKNSIPANAGRHWLKSSLLDQGVDPELINFQMGHWQAGEVPIGNYSALSHIEAINELVPILDKLFREVGWKPLKSVLS